MLGLAAAGLGRGIGLDLAQGRTRGTLQNDGGLGLDRRLDRRLVLQLASARVRGGSDGGSFVRGLGQLVLGVGQALGRDGRRALGRDGRLVGRGLSRGFGLVLGRALGCSWNQTAILAGPLIRFLAGVTASADEQVYPLRISNLVATFPNGTSAPIAATDGSITVLAGTSERLSEAGVLNAASLTAGPVAPGEIVTLLGHGIGPAFRAVPEAGPSSLALGGTSVWFDGKQAPLLLASSGQINAIVPYSVAGQTTEIVVRKEGLTAATASVPVGPAAPGIFVLSGNGVGPAAILNEDSTVNSAANPAQRGAVISIFATGAGRMDPPGADGQIGNGASQHPLLQVSVRIGDQDAEVLYAGAAPGLIAGALQVNCRIPLNVAAGVAVSVVFTVGEQTSPAGTTLSIQ